MQEKPTLIYIPPNVGGSGGGTTIGGVTTVRNIIEAIIVFALSFLIKTVLKIFIPFSFIGWIVIFAGLGFAFVCLMGVNGEPFSIFVLNVISYNNRRVFVTLRPPMPKKEEKQIAPSKFEQKIRQMVNKEKVNEEEEES